MRGAWETIRNTEFDAVDYAEGLAGRTGRQREMGGGWGEKLSESGFAGLLDAQDGETADYLTQRVGHYPDNRSILTFLILATRVERVPRPVRIALRDTPYAIRNKGASACSLDTPHASSPSSSPIPNSGSPATILTVSKLTLITWPMRCTMYCGSAAGGGVV